MSDEKPTPAPETGEEPKPVDAPVAHEVEEDPEQHIGEVIPDPWDDEDQDDWAGGPVDYPGVKN